MSILTSKKERIRTKVIFKRCDARKCFHENHCIVFAFDSLAIEAISISTYNRTHILIDNEPNYVINGKSKSDEWKGDEKTSIANNLNHVSQFYSMKLCYEQRQKLYFIIEKKEEEENNRKWSQHVDMEQYSAFMRLSNAHIRFLYKRVESARSIWGCIFRPLSNFLSTKNLENKLCTFQWKMEWMNIKWRKKIVTTAPYTVCK